MRRISCRDIGVDCDFVATGKDDKEVMEACARHGKQAHNMDKLPPELADKVKASIRDVT
jgi:predicted small metal-binding protein